MLLMGTCGICYEYVLGALGNYLMGSTQEQIYLIIGLMMFAMGMGAIIQKLLEQGLLEKFLLMEILLGLIGGISCTVIYLAHGYTRVHLPILWGFSFTIGLIIGLEIPLLIRVNKKYSASLKNNLSLILSLDYVGSLFGALLFTYILLKFFSLPKISLILGFTNVAIALMSLAYFRHEVKHFWGIFGTGCCVSILLSLFFFFSEPLQRNIEQQFFRDPIVASITTRYQHITITAYREQFALYINGHLQFSSTDEYIYHETLVHPAMMISEKPKNVLVLGGGDGLALREILKYPEVARVDLVDIDPEITLLARTHPTLVALNKNAFQNARVVVYPHSAVKPLQKKQEISIYNQNGLNPWDTERFPVGQSVQLFHLDADLFVQEVQTQKYDVIFLDFPDPQVIETAKLFSVEFYYHVRKLLKPQGIIAIQSGSPSMTQKVFACIGKTLQSAGLDSLPYHVYVPSLGDWGFYLAWDAKRHPEEVPRRLFQQSILVPTQYLNEGTIRASFCFGKDILLPWEEVKTNMKQEIVLPEYYRESR